VNGNPRAKKFTARTLRPQRIAEKKHLAKRSMAKKYFPFCFLYLFASHLFATSSL
jgi:hypothetical protein